MKARRLQKSQFSNILVNWEKFGSAALAFQKSQFTTFMNREKRGSIHSSRPTLIQILNLRMNWERIYPNLSFTVENKMGNLHKERMVTF